MALGQSIPNHHRSRGGAGNALSHLESHAKILTNQNTVLNLLATGKPVILTLAISNVGMALVMVAIQLPLGIWLMKGFFDNVSWDMERAALSDGCSRLRVWWEIMLPLTHWLPTSEEPRSPGRGR